MKIFPDIRKITKDDINELPLFSYKGEIICCSTPHDTEKAAQELIKEKIVSQIELNIPTYTKDNLPKSLSSIKAVKPGSRNL